VPLLHDAVTTVRPLHALISTEPDRRGPEANLALLPIARASGNRERLIRLQTGTTRTLHRGREGDYERLDHDGEVE
jgi:hypothetical protein